MKKFVAGLLMGSILMSGIVYGATEKIEVNFRPLKYYVNGVQKSAPAGFIHEGRTYVPLAAVADMLGKDVKWDSENSAIHMNDKSLETAIAEVKSSYGQSFENGTYRGIFADRGDIQVAVEFKLEDNKITEISFRQLFYSGKDYRTEKEDVTMIGLREQHEALINHLVGKDVRTALNDLYTPGNIVTEDVDVFTGATLRSGKIISAIRDGLNRGIYKY